MKTRCFIAINLPLEIKKELGFVIEKLKEKNSNKNIKWVEPEGIHLTLHFLGYLDEEKVKRVKKIIRENVAGFEATEIKLKNFNGFPNLVQPRVLFISGEENRGILNKLQTKIGQELEKIGIKIDHRPWQIHFTLARFKIPSKINVSCCMLHDMSFSIKSIDLMKSELMSTGAKYSVLESFSL